MSKTPRGGKGQKTVAHKKVTAAHLAQAALMTSEVIAHFGAGYLSARAADGETISASDPIFASSDDFKRFHDHLMNATSQNLADGVVSLGGWRSKTHFLRPQVTKTAFRHGALARAEVKKQKRPAVTAKIVTDTLKVAKQFCPPGGGGAGICD